MRTPIVERLRASTREIHDRVEAPFASLLREPTREVYARFLSAMWAFHHAIEPVVRPSFSRVAALRADLLALDLPEPCGRCRSPQLPTISHVFGARYVIEGSALGGRVLYRHISPALGFTAERGARFLYGAGDDTAMQFRSFVAQLSEHVERGGDADVIELGALETFGCLAELLGR